AIEIQGFFEVTHPQHHMQQAEIVLRAHVFVLKGCFKKLWPLQCRHHKGLCKVPGDCRKSGRRAYPAIMAEKVASATTTPSTLALPAKRQTLPRLCSLLTSRCRLSPGVTGRRKRALVMDMK